MGDWEPKLAIPYNQAILLVEGLDTNTPTKPLNYKFPLSTRHAGVNVAQKLWAQPTNDCSRMRPTELTDSFPQTLTISSHKGALYTKNPLK